MSKRDCITPCRSQEIIDLAEEVAGNQIPIDPIAILRAQTGISFRRGHFENAYDGLIEWCNGRFWIYSNLDRVGQCGSVRERFTVAHELGHYFIDEHRKALIKGTGRHPSFNDFQSDELAEREADLFAAHLLMPTRAFIDAKPKMPRGIPDILELKDQFGTSITSTAIRYVNHSDFFCAIIKWNDDGYGWSWASQETYENRYYRTVKSMDSLPSDSATQLVIQGETDPHGFIQCGSVASMWFDYVRVGGRRDAILQEQVISLGQYGYLTLLMLDSDVG